MTRIAVVPGVLALLPEYAAQQDPVPELRAACLAAVAWLGPDPVVLGDAQGKRVARALMSVVEEGRQARPSVVEEGRQARPSVVEEGRQARPSVVEEGRQAQPSVVEEGRQARPSVVEEGRQARLETTDGTGGFETGARAPSSTTNAGYLVVANGTARRSRSSPGPYDDRARPFDDVLAKALVTPDPEALRALDPDLARELWASTGALTELADLLVGGESVTVDYDDAPYGVQYWVVRYTW